MQKQQLGIGIAKQAEICGYEESVDPGNCTVRYATLYEPSLLASLAVLQTGPVPVSVPVPVPVRAPASVRFVASNAVHAFEVLKARVVPFPFPVARREEGVLTLEARAVGKQQAREEAIPLAKYTGLCGRCLPLTKPSPHRTHTTGQGPLISRPGTIRAQARRPLPRASNTSAAPRPLPAARSESGGRRARGKN